VGFPAHRRGMEAAYDSIESEQFDRVLRDRLPADALQLGATADDGDIDARGPGDAKTLDAGWQKFVGLLLNTEAPHGLTRPNVMDATVEQIEGYRFV